MIHFNIGLKNPWSRRWETVVSKFGTTPIKFMHWEFQFCKSNDIASFAFEFNPRTHHAGIKFSIGLIGYWMFFQVYDERHFGVS
jgi:hypothetical protein